MSTNIGTYSPTSAYQKSDDPYCICFDDKLSGRKALPYSQLLGAEFAQDSNAMSVSFTSMTVMIEGINLWQIFTMLINKQLAGISIGGNGDLKVINITYSMIPEAQKHP